MNNLIKVTFSAIVVMIVAASCTKESAVLPTPSSLVTEERIGTSTDFMNVLVYTKSAYDEHDAHDYAEGHILEFENATWYSLKAENALKITNALAYIKHAILTPGTNTFGHDTTGQYLNLFTYIIVNSSYMDTYPDSALIYGPDYPAFKTWFNTTCTDWMHANGCKNTAVSKTPTSKYLVKIHCGAN
ncbi:MAG TPA: hypothetical protein VE978_20445 [Chitinophagales bacterium]|nr:hypothetical protein [Chitinophagales bacterium]